MHALIVSPHLDDGAFSIPEPMAALREAGWQVTLATVFTRSVAAPTGFALACQLDKGLAADVDYMALRRAEDIAFCRALDLTPRHLDLPEAPHRGYEDVAALFGERRDDDPAHAAVAARLAELIATESPDLCIAPVGIGHHVDHQIVVEAITGLDATALRYADQPYAEKHPAEAEATRAAAGLAASAMFATDETRRRRAIQAITAYASQIGFQFGGIKALHTRLDAVFADGTPLWPPEPGAAVLLDDFLIPT